MGAGRPAGATTSGREVRAVARAALSTIIGTDKDPLVVLIDIATDETQPVPLRLEAAAVATRYVHPTLSAAAIQHIPAPSDAGPAVQVLLDRLAALAPSSGPVIDAEPLPSKVRS